MKSGTIPKEEEEEEAAAAAGATAAAEDDEEGWKGKKGGKEDCKIVIYGSIFHQLLCLEPEINDTSQLYFFFFRGKRKSFGGLRPLPRGRKGPAVIRLIINCNAVSNNFGVPGGDGRTGGKLRHRPAGNSAFTESGCR